MASKKKKYKSSRPKVKATNTAITDTTIPAQNTITEKPNTKWAWAMVLLVIIATLGAYSSGFDNQITNWDDKYYILDNPVLQDLSGETVKEMFLSSDPEVKYYMGNYHPMAMLSLAIDFQMGGKDKAGKIKPWPYITTNIVLHILNAALVFLVLFLLWGRVDIATIGALLFGVHALHVESVAWISERKDVLYMFFYLLALASYIYYVTKEKTVWLVVSLVLFTLSLLSKGQAVTLAPTLVLIDWFRGRKLLSVKVIVEKAPFFILALIFGLLAIQAQKHGQAIHRLGEYPFYIRILFACHGFSTYLFKLVFPTGLAAIYPYPILTRMQPTGAMWFGALSTAGFLGLTMWAYLKEYKNIFFGFAFFIINIILLLQLIPVGSAVMADRYSYIPSVGIHGMVAALLVGLITSKKLKPTVIYTGVGIYALLLMGMTFKQVNTWQNSMAVWEQTLKVSPKAIVAWNNLGSLKEQKAKDGEVVTDPALMEAAIRDFTSALRVKPDYTTALYNRGVALNDLKRYQEALNDFNEAIKFDPTFGNAYHNRGLVKDRIGKPAEAIKDFDKAIDFVTTDSKMYVNRGVSYGKIGKYDQAFVNFNKALEIDPISASAYSNRGLANDHVNNSDAALKDYAKALELKPGFKTALMNRAIVYQRIGKVPEAIADMSEVIKLDPNNAQLYYDRARMYLTTKQNDKICADLQAAQKLGMKNLERDIQAFCKK